MDDDGIAPIRKESWAGNGTVGSYLNVSNMTLIVPLKGQYPLLAAGHHLEQQ